jgi:hypothetical protein
LYHFQVASADDAGNIATSTDRTFTTVVVTVPVVDSVSASSITQTGATINASTTDNGGQDATEHGFAYGEILDLSTVIATSTLGAQVGVGAFSESITPLTCNTTYYYRPYATNYAGTGYGLIDSFTTDACSVAPGPGEQVTPGSRTGGGSVSIGSLIPELRRMAEPSFGCSLGQKFDTRTGQVCATITTTTLPFLQTLIGVFRVDLKLNSVGADVKKLQQFLNTHGFPVSTSGVGSLGRETTLFGPATQSALIRFQKAKKITPAIGIFGPVTRGVVNSVK